MDNEAENAAPSPPSGAAKRGRPPRAAAETQQQRVERLQAELRAAQDALKLTEERRASIIGAAALRHARKDGEFRRVLAAALRAEVKGKADLAAIADLLLEGRAPSSA